MKRNTNTRKTFTTSISTLTLALALTAGSAMAMNAPDDKRDTRNTTNTTNNPNTRNTNRANVDMDEHLLHFARADKLMGTELRNYASDSIGTVEDFIIDRGSGHIKYAVVKSGDILGFGGKSFALPYEQLRYMPATADFQTSMTEAELEQRTEFVPENWAGVENRGWMDGVSDWFNDDRDADRNARDGQVDHAEDSIREAIKKGDRETIDGRVTRVLRKTYKGDEQVFVIVEDENKEQHTLILGPSWYLTGMENSVRQDDKVSFSVVEYDTYYVVADGTVNRKQMMFRDKQGQGSWSTKNAKSKGRYMLLSDLSGLNVQLAGTTVGEIQTSLVEGGSGQVAMIAVDPNDNFLGLGDEISLVPWTAFTYPNSEYAMILGNETELQRTVKMPDDVSTLRTPSSVAHAYETYGIDMPKFEARDLRTKNAYDKDTTSSDTRDKNAKRSGDAWSKHSGLVDALRDGKSMQLTGEFQGLETEKVIEGAPEAHVMIVKTKTGTERLIVGPKSFGEKQKLNLKKGDTVTINAKRASFDGREWMTILNVESGENRWDFWNGNDPAWSM